MSTQNPTAPTHSTRNTLVAGLAFIALGIVALAGQFVEVKDPGLFIPLLLGGIFLAWGLISRSFGLLIPGGILGGIGLGIAVSHFLALSESDPVAEAVILLGFACGWLLITALSTFTAERTQWWPLIPGGILGAVGAFILAGEPGLQVLEFIGRWWALGLVALGIVTLAKVFIPRTK